MLSALTMLSLAIACVIAPPPTFAQQGGTTRYVYDDNGRLRAVVTPAGEAAVYEYDPAGNFTAINRISADTLTLLAFFPHEGGAGDQVTFVGTGFNAGVTSVSFNGSAARIVEVTPSAVIAEVPDAATTGPVTIITPRGALITPVNFVIVQRVRVLPSSARLLAGESMTFTASIGGGGDQSVRWAVNGIEGGNTSVGTISSAGLYTAPTPTGNLSLSVVVRATSVAQPSLFGEAQVRVINPNNLGTLFAPSVSIAYGDPRFLNTARSRPTSVRRKEVATPASRPVSVRRRGLATSASPPVSVRRKDSTTVFGTSISVQRGGVIANNVTILSPFVTATRGPVVSAISPNSLARGATVTLTITGSNLGGASALRFIDANGVIDSGLAASNLTVNADGTSLTATVAVNGAAALGKRVVVVTASAGSTPAVDAGANTITVTQ
jgi:YD repeat-containing protein